MVRQVKKKTAGTAKGRKKTTAKAAKPVDALTVEPKPSYTVPFPQGQTLLQQLAQMRGYVQEVLDNEPDRELRLKAVDRRHKQIELEAKLQGEFKQDQSNPHDSEALIQLTAQKLVDRLKARGKEMSLDDALTHVRQYNQTDTVH